MNCVKTFVVLDEVQKTTSEEVLVAIPNRLLKTGTFDMFTEQFNVFFNSSRDQVTVGVVNNTRFHVDTFDNVDHVPRNMFQDAAFMKFFVFFVSLGGPSFQRVIVTYVGILLGTIVASCKDLNLCVP